MDTTRILISAIFSVTALIFWIVVFRTIMKRKKEKSRVQAEVAAIRDTAASMLYKLCTDSSWWGVTESELVTDRQHVPFPQIDSIGMNYPKRKILYTVRDAKQYRPGALDFESKDFETAAKAYLFIIERAFDAGRLQRAKREIAVYQGKEIRMRCSVCGKFFCYNYQDLVKNNQLKQSEALEAFGALASSLAVSTMQGAVMSGNADRIKAQIRDFNRCPHCNSTDLTDVSEEEFKRALAAGNATESAPAPSAASAADEIKRFKELLDEGIITQEEFDVKKKQLLGL